MCNIPLFPVTRDFTWMPWLFKYHREWPSDRISQLSQDFGIHLIRSCSGSLGGHQLGLILQCEKLGSPSPCLEVHSLDRCGKRGCQCKLSMYLFMMMKIWINMKISFFFKGCHGILLTIENLKDFLSWKSVSHGKTNQNTSFGVEPNSLSENVVF